MLTEQHVILGQQQLRNLMFALLDVSLLGRYEVSKPAKQQNTPEDQNPESSHEYLQYQLVQVYVLYCDSLNSTDL
jgi:hypothetical protein